MEDTLGGVVAASIICCVMLLITIVAIYYTCRRCRGISDDKTSHQDPLINGHVRNGSVPTVSRSMPYPIAPPTRDLYHFPTMPTRHMASYRPRYIEERAPAGPPKQDGTSVIVRAHTYNGPYTQQPGAVVYDVAQPKGFRNQRVPLWAQKSQGEAYATMTLGEESPTASANQVPRNGISEPVPGNTENEFTFSEKRSSRTKDVDIPSPDETRREYLFTKEEDPPKLPAARQPANQVPHPTSGNDADFEPANEWSRDSLHARQRKPTDGYLPERLLPVVSGHHTKAPHRDYTPPMERDEAVYIASSAPHPVSNDNIHSISHQPPQHYYFTNDMYTVSSKVSDRGKYVDQPSSGYPGVATYAPSVSSPDVNQIPPNFRGSFPEPLDTVTDPSVVWPPSDPRASGVGPSQPNVFTLQEENQNEAERGLRESHTFDRRVIKSKRRPSWLRNAGALFSRAKRNK
ncbi:uncharacterized protein [Haliotis cracherodii]|uniref:uncharacterized protein n=1 Tax=Haliotis cracherodii TaxID=6455 RepID=UPI0039E92C06